MKFWNDALRICPKCKHSVDLDDDQKARCPHCKSTVWFFNYRSLEEPPELPLRSKPTDLVSNPLSLLLLVSTGIFGIVTLVAVFNSLIVAATCSLAAIGFAIFGFVRHAEAVKSHDALKHSAEIQRYAEVMRDRAKELTRMYVSLLKTGDSRIQHYYDDIYVRAEGEQQQARWHRDQAIKEREAIAHVEQRIFDMAQRFIEDHLRWVKSKLRPDPENYQRNKINLKKAFDFVEMVGYDLPKDMRKDALNRLKSDYKNKVREQMLKEEQRRIKQQMREEDKLRRERDKALKEAQDKEREIQIRLQQMLRERRDEHDAEVMELRRQLAEAESNAERAKSMAQLTRAGHVYVLSNIGSFGEEIFKVGMTRRLEPQDRVKELGDASVPFPFDVHAMISCEDAPTLEKALHHRLTRFRVNRVNLRKEYFRVDLETILHAVRQHHGIVEYVAEPEALEYRETLEITPEELVDVEGELVAMGVEIEEMDD